MQIKKEEVKNIINFLILIFLLMIQSCKDLSNPIVPIDNNFIYPLKVGSQWNYNASAVYTNFRPDSINNYLKNYSIEIKVSVTKDTLLNSFQVKEMKEESQGYPDSYSYYSNEKDGLIKYAYSNTPSLVLPKANVVKRFIYKNKYYNSIEELIKKQEDVIRLSKASYDSIIFLEQPKIIYKYPLEIGQEWIFSSSVVRINKEVIGKETVKTNVGYYECFKIQWKYDSDDDFIYYEYVSSKGMVKTEIIIKDLSISTLEHPEGIGKVDVKYERLLNGINF